MRRFFKGWGGGTRDPGNKVEWIYVDYALFAVIAGKLNSLGLKSRQKVLSQGGVVSKPFLRTRCNER